MKTFMFILLATLMCTEIDGMARAQTAGPPVANCLQKSWRDPPPTYKSVEVLGDGRLTFRVCAPLAKEARVTSSDIPDVIPSGMNDGIATGLPMVRDQTGLWSATTEGPVAADTYRFNFQVDGAAVPDPRGTTWSQQVSGITTTLEVPGPAGAFQSYNLSVPHGVVSVVEYWSKSLNLKRQAHVYTPPGYMEGSRRYPVLYLVHGAGDSDDSWTSVGHAQYILDNLIASGKAKPMIIIMPAGHTPARPGRGLLRNEDFGNDLIRDVIPMVDGSFRTLTRPRDRAMAGLSMGGAHTINFGLTHPDLFRYIGIFSMGLGLEGGPAEFSEFKQSNAIALRDAAKDMQLVYYAVGRNDFLYASIAPTRAMFDEVGIHTTYVESEGGHTWINWRRYLNDFAPKLFR